MMNTLKRFLPNLIRIMVMRASPERILYSRSLFICGLLLAMILSGVAQMLFHLDHVVFAILRVFAEVTMFMVWVVLLTAKVARLRLASVMLCLVWFSVLGDSLLLALSTVVPESMVTPVALLAATPLIYGAANVIGWGKRVKMMPALVEVAIYVAAVMALDGAFRALYNLYAGA